MELIEYLALINTIYIFLEGDLSKLTREEHYIRISFFRDHIISSKSYIIFGSIQLLPNNNYLD